MEKQFEIQGMKCGGCVSAVERAAGGVAGVTGVSVDLEHATATVTGDFDPDEVARVVTEAGYPARAVEG